MYYFEYNIIIFSSIQSMNIKLNAVRGARFEIFECTHNNINYY